MKRLSALFFRVFFIFTLYLFSKLYYNLTRTYKVAKSIIALRGLFFAFPGGADWTTFIGFGVPNADRT